MIDLAIIVISYNSSQDIISLIKQLKTSQLDVHWHLYIIDNNSTPDQQQQLKNISPSQAYTVQFLTSNIGFGAACNLACSQANAHRYLFLNPDITLQKNTIEQLLINADAHPTAAIWGAVTTNEKNISDNRAAWREPSISNTFGWATGLRFLIKSARLFEGYSDYEKHALLTVDATTGCCMLVNASLWETLNGFDPRFFLYSEEMDLCKRARGLGAQPTIVRAARLQHSAGQSSTTSARLQYLFYGKKLYAQKHFSPFKYQCYWACCVLGIFIRAVVIPSKAQRDAWQLLLKKITRRQLSYEQ